VVKKYLSSLLAITPGTCGVPVALIELLQFISNVVRVAIGGTVVLVDHRFDFDTPSCLCSNLGLFGTKLVRVRSIV
jgi:hypothetical protein